MGRDRIGWLCISLALYGSVAGLVLYVLPADHVSRLPLLLVLYLCAAAFSAITTFRAARLSEGPQKRFWSTLAAGVVLRVLGDAGWAVSVLVDPPPATDMLYQAAWVASYGLLFLALGVFIARVNRRLALLAAIDSMAVLMTVMFMAYYFVIQPVLANPEGLVAEVWIGFPSVVPELLRRPAADITLFFLSLAVLSADHKPRSAGLVSVAFFSFCVADALLLRTGVTFSGYEMDNALGTFWAVGLILLGLAAFSSTVPSTVPLGPREEPVVEERAEPWWAIMFWLGPLSPAVLYGFLLVWVMLSGSTPDYVLAGAVLLLVYLAFRISILMYVNRILAQEREDETKRAERGRIAGELDSTLQQTVHAVPALLESYRGARETDPEAAESILRRTEEEAREASYRVSYPVRELQALSGDTAMGPKILVDQLLSEVETNFGMRIHRHLEASPEDLSSGELASTYRIVSEALWNAGKHSRANNIWVASKYVGSIFLVKVHDDGRGFDMNNSCTGLGIPLMRGRAAGMGASLDLISKPGIGTTVQIRFDAGGRLRH